MAWSSCCSNFAKVKDLAKLLVNLIEGLPVNTDFSVVQFSSDARVVSGLSSAAQTSSTIDYMTYTGGLDNHGSAIQSCQQTLSSSPNDKRIIMLITDGQTGMPPDSSDESAELAANSAEGDGSVVVPVLVSPDPPDTNENAIPLMERISSDGRLFDFTEYTTGVSSALVLREELLDHLSCL